MRTMKLRGPSCIDGIDLRILDALQKNARAPLASIAEDSGISSPPTLRRIRRLKERGFIRGYHAYLNSSMLGFDLLSFVSVNLRSQSEIAIKTFESEIRSNENVRECYAVSGNRDFLLKCAFRDEVEKNRFVFEFMTGLHNIDRVTVLNCIAVCKELAGFPIETASTSP